MTANGLLSTPSSLEKEEQEICKDKCISKRGQLTFHEGAWLNRAFVRDQTFMTELKNFQVYEGDIFVAGFPKSGTTWLQEITWQIAYGPKNDGHTSDVNMEEKFPHLEYFYPGLEALKKRPSPRLIKTHLPFHLLPISVRQGHGKVIYVVRNPKDVCVSYYNFIKMFTTMNFKGSFEHFQEDFISGRVSYGPWTNHVKQFWEHKGEENILFITYEDLRKDARGVIRQIAEFLGYRFSDDELQKIVHNTSFDVMKNNPLVNYSWRDDFDIQSRQEARFMRKGKVGDWKNYITPEMAKEMEDKLLAPLKAIDLNFKDS